MPLSVIERAGLWAGRSLAVSLLALASACGGTAAKDASEVRIAVRADVTGFFPNPPILNEGYTMDVNWNLFEGLVRYDRKFQVEPAVAERWENPDEKTYVFTLRKGVRFSDGRPVTARDVAASLLAPRARHWVTRGYVQAIESARALSPTQVEVKTRFPYLILLSRLPWGHILPADDIEKGAAPAAGTGPYALESWTPGHEFVFRRNPNSHGPAPAFARARFTVVPDADERVARVVRGDADVADQVSLGAVASLQTETAARVRSAPGIRVLMLVLRVDRPPFSDPRLREALDLAIDREELNARVLLGRGEPASQLVPARIVGYNPALHVTQPDRARTRMLLAEAGFAKGLRFRLDGPRNRYLRDVEILQELKRQLDAAGFDVELNIQEKNVFYALLDAGRSTAGLLGWSCATGEAGDGLDSLLHSQTTDVMGSDNVMGLADPELDRLIERANGATSAAERTRLLQDSLARVAEVRPIIPLVVQPEAVAISGRIDWEPPLNFALRVEDMRPAP